MSAFAWNWILPADSLRSRWMVSSSIHAKRRGNLRTSWNRTVWPSHSHIPQNKKIEPTPDQIRLKAIAQTSLNLDIAGIIWICEVQQWRLKTLSNVLMYVGCCHKRNTPQIYNFLSQYPNARKKYHLVQVTVHFSTMDFVGHVHLFPQTDYDRAMWFMEKWTSMDGMRCTMHFFLAISEKSVTFAQRNICPLRKGYLKTECYSIRVALLFF